MNFIYRTPMLNFDIFDTKEVEYNYQYILEAIKLSSTHLYEQIKDTPYSQLDYDQQVAVLKYLIRGKYRATPFALWAGVGMGLFSDLPSPTKYKLTFQSFDLNAHHVKGKYHLPALTYRQTDQFTFWKMDEDKNWNQVTLESNAILEKIYNHFHSKPDLSFPKFKSWFLNVEDGEIRQIWGEIINCGFLTNQYPPQLSKINSVVLNDPRSEFPKDSQDYPIHITSSKEPFQLEKTHYRKLEKLNKEIGNLLHTQASDFIRELKSIFIEEHDDRFVPLHQLLNPGSATARFFKNQVWLFSRENTPPNPINSAILAHSGKKTMNLKPLVKSRKVTEQPATSYLCRITERGLLIDHVVTNRPAATWAKISLAVPKASFHEDIQHFLDSSTNVLHADFEIWESDQSNHIACHKNLLQHTIRIFTPSKSSFDIDYKSLYLGLVDDRFVIYSPHTQQVILPTIQHALNPQYITHPISRLLYEVASQGSLYPVYEDLMPISGAPAIPRLTWGEVILKPAAWYVTADDGKSWTSNRFLAKIKELGIPRYCLYGEEDEKMVIDTHHCQSVDILMELIKNKPSFVLSECLWIEDSEFPSYPQLSISIPNSAYQSPYKHVFFNPKKHVDRSWIGYHIYVDPLEAELFLTEKIGPWLDQNLRPDAIHQWYYLTHFDSAFHIRLRIGPNSIGNDRVSFEKELLHFLSQADYITSFKKATYYPELAKYGNRGIFSSEDLFKLESVMAIYGNVNSQLPYLPTLLQPELEKISLIANLGLALLKRSGQFRAWQQETENGLIKDLKNSQKSKFKKVYEESLRSKKVCHSVHDQGFVQKYISFFLEHPLLYDKNNFVPLFNHHFHMMINRFFLSHHSHIEPLVWYTLYRKVLDYRHSPIPTPI
ncbi:thiopeptide-type bacteriocin biosynthesis protein [Litoribacter alkaliphilus]|uniref:Thiopeptide-type bacteriocin biosynthesis protein n=1 Tax=Litoribacter ruber TaxID=702568 RepID=A0AAP2CL83_9BACT|nr:thiopeptide-type bacteriocin biosynthesis protein [Litoribacter alkaliphilus]MBS9526000.1 thiopeptide-type bacteriocin biosynthesis protein [Litoribacter alkaliphilus]